MHYPTIVWSLNFFAAAVLSRSAIRNFESRYQIIILVAAALAFEFFNARQQGRPYSLTHVAAYAGSATIAVVMTKWAIEGIPWWIHRWFV